MFDPETDLVLNTARRARLEQEAAIARELKPAYRRRRTAARLSRTAAERLDPAPSRAPLGETS
jgi:hypothetical protein